MRGIFSLPAMILMLSFVGFCAFTAQAGIPVEQVVFMVGAVWALPAKVILVSSILGGANLLTAFIAVTLSSIRLMPMVAALVPEIRTEKTPTWLLLFLSHFVAITAWVFAMERVQAVPREHRVAFFAGFGITLVVANMVLVAAVYQFVAEFPPIVAGCLFFPDAGLFPGVDLEFGPSSGDLRRIDYRPGGWTVLLLARAGIRYSAGGRWRRHAGLDGRAPVARTPGGPRMTVLEGWWAYVFIAIAGWLATDLWRWLGVLAGNRLREDSEVLNWVRAVATALVAAVIAKLILYPTGILEQSPLWLRLGSIRRGCRRLLHRPAETGGWHWDGNCGAGDGIMGIGILRNARKVQLRLAES